MRFSREDVLGFAAWSRDRNPLHVDPDFARQTHFGAPVVHGALSVLTALKDAAGRSFRLSSLDIEFKQAVVPERDYLVRHAPVDGGFTLVVDDGTRTAITIAAETRALLSPAPDAQWVAMCCDESRETPAAPTLEALGRGAEVMRRYSIAPPPVELGHTGLSPLQARVLALCSYVTGMELPGLRSLFLGARIEFHADIDVDTLCFRARATRVDRTFRLLHTALEAATPSGVVIATATLRSYVPFSPVTADIGTLRAHLPPPASTLDAQVALVCGASRGLGADVSAALALAGCRVYAAARTIDAAAGTLRDELVAAGAYCELLQGDVSDPAWCETTREMLVDRHGRVDILVLNACAPPSALQQGTTGRTRYIQENVALTDAPLSAFSDAMRDSGGVVVYISSSYVAEPPKGLGHYAAVKQAGETLVRAVVKDAPELAALIARPPALQTRWNDTPATAGTAIPSSWAALRIVEGLASDRTPGHVAVLSEFPPIAPGRNSGSSDAVDATVRIASTFTTDPLLPGIDFWFRELAIDARTVMAPYGQVMQALLDPTSLFASRARGLNVVLVRVRDWLRELADSDADDPEFVRRHLATAAEDFAAAVRAFRQRSSSELLILICPSLADDSSAVRIAMRDAEDRLGVALRSVPSVTVVTTASHHDAYQVDEDAITDAVRDKAGHIPYRDWYYDVLATLIARHLHHVLTPRRKVVVVDCDNTLWSGVVGEVGPEGLHVGAEHRALHEQLARLADAGVLVCLCSKNEEPDVWRVFDARTDIGLRRDQIVAAAINWQPKSANLTSLAARLNLGLDSFVFIDDNPVECAEVRANCPGVLVLEWPTDTERALRLLRHTWEFDMTAATAEDVRRTQMYKEEFRRRDLRDSALTFSDFIQSLDLQVTIAPLSDDDLRRASQLTLRTNQFNFTTIRRDESEVRALAGDGAHEILTVRVRDRFGDYGLVGLVILETASNAWRLDTFLLSCRVLGRGVEHHIVGDIGRRAMAAHAATVDVRLDITPRNTPARAFLESIAPADSLNASDERLHCQFTPEQLAAVQFDLSRGGATVEDEDVSGSTPVTSGSLTQAGPAREAQIYRTSFDLSTIARLHAAVAGERGILSAPTSPGAPIADIVYQAFASALRVPADTVRAVDRLEALGCESLKIVEITVALTDRFPFLPSTLLFEHRRVSDIANAIEALLSTRSAGAAALPAVEARARALTGDVAVVGMDVRCAGANSPQELWDLLAHGRIATRPVPRARPHFLHPLSDSRPHWAGLLDDVARFDAAFFRVSPREADVMDPQLRLFIEVAWHALEDAGLGGATDIEDTGVFAGVMYADYGTRANQHGASSNAYRCWEGFSLANRLSQLLGFNGPSLAIDTACSSSGTALHVACGALARGDCRIAVVGGVNLILDPDRFASLGRLGILSPTGRCEPFGANADGTVLGEGAGVVILRPLEDALERGDRIYGVIKGTGVSTGSGTVGFTAPNPKAQAHAIRRSLEASGIDPRTITYVEAHGTGTQLGDPIEVRGLSLAYGDPQLQDRSLTVPTHCRVGSIKGNIGHLEAGAGVVSLIKVLLQLQHGELLPSITSPAPNPQIPLADTPFRVQATVEPWQRPVATRDGVQITLPRRAGINSFGVGGANAHIVVEEAPATAPRHRHRPMHLLALSAPGETALNRQLDDAHQFVETREDLSVHEFCATLNTARRHDEARVAIVASSRDQLLQRLHAAARSHDGSGVIRGHCHDKPRLAFLFSGQGSQYAGMGRGLYDASPVFRDALDRSASIFDRLLDRPLLDLLFAAPASHAAELLDQTGYTQPALFAFEYALARLWQSWGVEPDVVMGHSVGEIGAMCIAGGLSLEDALRLIAARGRLMQALPPGGTMTSIMAAEDQVLDRIAGFSESVAIAAVNAPSQIVISGAGAAVAEIAARCAADGIRTHTLQVSHAFHSPLMKPMLAEYERVVRDIAFSVPKIPFVSCVDGCTVTDDVTRAEYWLRQVTDPVRFAAGMAAIDAMHVDGCIEIGPQPVLLGIARQCLREDHPMRWLPSLRRDADEWQMLLSSVGGAYAMGASIDWHAFEAPYRPRRVPVPTYAYGGKSHWLAEAPSRPEAADPSAVDPASIYTLSWRKTGPADATETAEGRWVLVVDGDAHVDAIAAELTARGGDVRVIGPGEPLDIPEYSRVVRLWTTHTTRHAETLAGSSVMACQQALEIVRATVRAKARVWLVTRGGAAVDNREPLAIPSAAVWGFGRTAIVEHPRVCRGLIDVAGDRAFDAAALATELLTDGVEDQVTLRAGVRYVARLTHADLPRANRPPLHSEATYLVTGGLGALGLHCARWLVDSGARHVVLAGRHARSNAATAAVIRDLENRGAQVTVAVADVSLAGDVDTLLSTIACTPWPLRGVIHAAGVDRVAALSELTSSDVRAVFAPKVTGALLLDERTRHLPLDLFVCFSSMAAVLGASGRAHYAAANAALDAIASDRRQAGTVATAVNWGPWAGGGMADAAQLERFEAAGNRALDPAAALAALDAMLARGDTQAVVADVDWSRFRLALEQQRARPLVSEIAPDDLAAPAAPRRPDTGDWVSRLRDTSPDARLATLVSLLKEEVASLLGSDDSEVPETRSFYDLGMDSLRMAELVGRLNRRVGTSCTALVFDHPSVRPLAASLLERLPLHAKPSSANARREADGPAAREASVDGLGSFVAESGIVRYSLPIEEEAIAFQRAAWPHRPGSSLAARWRWMFVQSAARLRVEPKTWLYRDNGHVVAHMGSIPVRLKAAESVLLTGWLVDTMVLASHRSRALGLRLMDEARDDQPFSLSLGQTREMRDIQHHLGWSTVAPLQSAQRLLRPERVLSTKVWAPVGWAAGLGLRAAAGAARIGPPDVGTGVRLLASFDERHDELWDTAAATLTCAVVRDASYLNWKYVDQPGQEFVRLEIGDEQRPCGIAVLMFREPDDSYRYRRAFIVDVVTRFTDQTALRRVIGAAVGEASRRGADAINCLHTDVRLTRALKACGFFMKEPTRHLLIHATGVRQEARVHLLDANAWFVTHGDSDIDRPGQ